jgi:hypothetical protein
MDEHGIERLFEQLGEVTTPELYESVLSQINAEIDKREQIYNYGARHLVDHLYTTNTEEEYDIARTELNNEISRYHRECYELTARQRQAIINTIGNVYPPDHPRVIAINDTRFLHRRDLAAETLRDDDNIRGDIDPSTEPPCLIRRSPRLKSKRCISYQGMT